MPVYIEKINGDVNQPTNQPTDRQSGQVHATEKKIERRKTEIAK